MSVVCEGTGTQPSIADLLEGLCDLNRIHSGLYPFNFLLWHHVLFPGCTKQPLVIGTNFDQLCWRGLVIFECVWTLAFKPKHFCLQELGLAFIHYHSVDTEPQNVITLTNTATEKSQRNACVIIRKVTKSYIHLKMMKSYSRHKAFSRKLYIFDVYHAHCHDVWKLITL